MKYGKHTDLVEAFLAHLESGNVDWKAVRKVIRRASWDDASDDAWVTASDAAGNAARSDARSDAWYAAWDAAWDADVHADAYAAWAACEILGHEVLAEQGKPLVFLPIFGIESIEQLKEMVK